MVCSRALTFERPHRLGIISRATERFFYYSQFLSVSQWLLKPRVRSIEENTRGGHIDISAVRRRSSAIERYLVVWLLVEISLFVGLLHIPAAYLGLAMIPTAYRAFEVFQTVINVNLFDPFSLREPGRNYVASLARLIILSLWNYMEIVLCFAIYYASAFAHFNVSPCGKAIGRSAAIYFSAVTQLTIGYGDISPTGITRLFATLQGLIAFIIALFAVSRIVALLPEFIVVPQQQTDQESESKHDQSAEDC